MAITDELRSFIKDPLLGYASQEQHVEQLTAIADRIDAALAEHYVELPKDADGEYIHVEDEMCGYGWPNGGVYCRAIVNEVMILVGPQDGAYRGWLMWAANECRHYHAPTVEDVLRGFVNRWMKATCYQEPDLIAEYAAKLRLVGSDVE